MKIRQLLCALGVSLCAFGGSLELAVRGHAPVYSVVIAKDAAAPYVSAAQECVQFIEQMTGVTLKVVDDSQEMPPAAILIGPNRFSRQVLGERYDKTLKDVKDDGFLLKVSGNHMVILGGVRGGQYGVYELLERFGGCRWYSSWYSVIPTLQAFSVPDDLDDLQQPAFLSREPFWRDMFETMQAVRNKCNGNEMHLSEANGGKIKFGRGMFVHTLGRLVTIEEYFGTHPEYFSEINGVRIKDSTQLCLSNPDVLKLVTARVLESIRRDPAATLFSVSQNDWYNPCQCAGCQKIKEQTGGTESGIMIWFVNQVAEAVEKEYPNVLIETLAYQYTREPPKKIRPRHNVVPRLCTIECDFGHPLAMSQCVENKKFVKDIQGWAAISNKMLIWDYVTDFRHYVMPYPNFNSIQANIQLFRDCHVVGVLSQGAYQGWHGDFSELKGWIGAKLLWNPDADVNALLDDFMKGYYGAAAPFVRKYFDALHGLVKETTMLSTFEDVSSSLLTDDFLLEGTDLWKQAEEAVKNDPERLYNVRKGAMTVYYARLMRLIKSRPIDLGCLLKDKLIVAKEAETNAGKKQLYRDLALAFMERFASQEGRHVRICEMQKKQEATLAIIKALCEGKDNNRP